MTTISALLLTIALVCVVRSVTSFSNLTTKQLYTIRTLRGHEGCQETYYLYEPENQYMKLPWFCVKPGTCGKKWDLLDSLIPLRYKHEQTNYVDEKKCTRLFFNDGLTECCFIGNLEEFLEFEVADWPKMSYPENGDFWDSTSEAVNAIYEEDMEEVQSDDFIFRELEVCMVYPVGMKKNSTLYAVHFCIDERACSYYSEYNTPPAQGAMQELYNFCHNNVLDRRTVEEGYQEHICCHPRAIITEDQGRTTFSNWTFRTFPTYTKYAPAVRSSMQCEMYSKYVCQGENDMCPFRILFKDWETAYPMEGYHQALIGIKNPRVQVFFCQGTLVSRWFILSAAKCADHLYTKANLALLGDYNVNQLREPNSDELYTYIIEHHTMPAQRRESSKLKPDPFIENVILFKLWRSVTFSPFRRPACVAYPLRFPGVEHWLENRGIFTTYGKLDPGKYDVRWNDTLRRYMMQMIDYDQPNCRRYFPAANDSDAYASEIVDACMETVDQESYDLYDISVPRLNDERVLWGPCKFDLGAPLLELLTMPYCQYVTTGVLTRTPVHCKRKSTNPYLVRKMEYLAMWIEQQIYKEDFDIFGFDLTWPTCDRNNWQFIKMVYLRKENSQFYHH